MSTLRAMLARAFIVIYGAPGTGKTTDAVATLPISPCVTRTNALMSALARLGLGQAYGLPPIPVGDDGSVGYALNLAAKTTRETIENLRFAIEQGFTSFSVDDISLNLGDENRQLRRELGSAGRAVFNRYDRLADDECDLRDLARAAGGTCVFTLHERDPYEVTNGTIKKLVPGGPLMATKGSTDVFLKDCDIGLRRVSDTHLNDEDEEVRTDYYLSRCDHFGAKDRSTLAPPRFRARLRGLFMAHNVALDRFPGLEWQDEFALMIADRVTEKGDPWAVALAETLEATAGRWPVMHPAHLRWAAEDAATLIEVRLYNKDRAMRDMLSMFDAPKKGKKKAKKATPATNPAAK